MISLCKFPCSGNKSENAEASSEGVDNNSHSIWIGQIGCLIFSIHIFGYRGYMERIGLSAGICTESVGSALGLFQFTTIVGAGLAAIISLRFGRTLPILISLTVQASIVWLLVGEFSSISFYIGTGLYQGLFVFATAYQLGLIATLDIKGRFPSLVTAFQGLGDAVGPALAVSLISDGD